MILTMASKAALVISLAIALAAPANAQATGNAPSPTLPPGFQPEPLPLGKAGPTVPTPLTPPLPPDTVTIEMNVDRSGGDYRSFAIAANQADPRACQSACQADAQCLAFTYVLPGVQGPEARCWLKNQVPAAQASNCCVSGVRVRRP